MMTEGRDMSDPRNIPEPDFDSPEEVDAYLVAHGYNLDTLQRNMHRFMTLLKRAIASRKQYHVRECYPGEPTPEDDWRVYAYGDEDEMIVDFDTPAGRNPADRIVLALRYPHDRDAEPIGSVYKLLDGRVHWLVVYEADVLAALVRMGWREGGAS